jgi:hypothetical protein
VSRRWRVALALTAVAWFAVGRSVVQSQNRGAPPAAPATAKASAPIDLTGYWVAFVTEDWRFRMVTPAKGDYQGIPLTPEGVKIANGWDPAADEAAGNQCKSYGAAAIMRVPGRLHITWQDEDTLRVDADAGTQTRLFHFAAGSPPAGQPTWQGRSTARWERPARGRGGNPEPQSIQGGSLTVVTTNMRAGYLRKNGVPYSENAALTEYFDIAPQPKGGQLLVVTSVVEDSRFLQQPLILSSHFKKEADGSRWEPTPCSAS